MSVNGDYPASGMLPVLFIGHGAPTILLRDDPVLDAWRNLARLLPRPRYILVVSSHWETPGFVIGGNRLQRTVHDFYGFPDALYEYQYPAPSSVPFGDGLAEELSVSTDHDRGLDHAAWIPLITMYPHFDVPVLQLSVSPRAGCVAHLELGKRLSKLRQQGVLILASGVLVHNLSSLNWDIYTGEPEPWACEFMASFQTAIVAQDADILSDPHGIPFGRQAVPTLEHYLPLLIALGAARGDPVHSCCQVWRYCNLSMHSYCFSKEFIEFHDI